MKKTLEEIMKGIQERADRLIEDGYTIDKDPNQAGLYWVTKPFAKDEQGAVIGGGASYAVYCSTVSGFHCGCEAFKRWNTCKHLLAVAKALEGNREEEEADYYDWLATQPKDDPFAD